MCDATTSPGRSPNVDQERGAHQVIRPRRRLPESFEDETWRSLRWLILFLLSLLAGTLDPLFFYIPVVNDRDMCVRPDKKLGIIAIVLRTCFDVVHSFFWMLCYEDCIRLPLKKWWLWIARKCGCSCVLGTETDGAADAGSVRLMKEAREAEDTYANKDRSSMDEKSDEWTMLRRVIEVASILPLPQVVTILIILRTGSPKFTDAVTLLKLSVLSQLIVRTLRVYPSFKGATRCSFLLLKGRVWVGSALNLLLFVIAGHAIGAFWYLLSLGRSLDCWRNACKSHGGCQVNSLYCGSIPFDKSFLTAACPVDSASDPPPFDFGIYLDALKSHIVSAEEFPLKLGYCFWWGLRNLSSLGQNLSTSAYLWEVCFAISISIIGLILFSLFIGNMQMFLQSKTDNDLKEMKGMMEKREKMKNVRKSLVKWKPFSSLSKDLRSQIFLCDDPKWLETKNMDLKSIVENMLAELGMQIKLQLCFPLLSQIPALEQVDKGALEALCKRAKPIVFREMSSILREDSLIDKIYLIIGGNLCYQDKQECVDLFLGEELLHKAISASNSPRLFPAKTILASTKVEAFSITAFDVKKVRTQFQGRFYKQEKEEWANSAVQKVVSRFSQKKAVDSPKHPGETDGTMAFGGHEMARDRAESSELSPYQER
ncbi:hypothetical protein MLD38_030429 [Melastoma candidum]|uniref:Uncharacterized protein n=1 Tax=Melastoma candidum TaxID=119954 RepID=A0ACB9MN54_9MYRT|nr:hypothetical protein MLD38_030429 [Melastoma candidum]